VTCGGSSTVSASVPTRTNRPPIFAGQLSPKVAAVCPDRTAERAALIASQVLGMALCRYILRLPPLVAMPADEVVAWLGPTLQRYLTGT
jgi:hypothetical protein